VSSSRARGAGPHVVVDARMIRDSGIGTYIRHSLPGILAARPEWRFTLLGDPAHLEPLVAGRVGTTVRTLSSTIYSLSEQVEMLRVAPRPAELFWSPHYNIPMFHPGRLLVTVHDVFHLAMREFVPGPHRRAYARAMFTMLRHRADGVICGSEFTRSEFLRLVGPPRRSPRVVYYGIDEGWRAAPITGSPHYRPYLLYVGNVKPHKNLPAALRAFASIASRVPHDFIIVGRREGMRSRDETVDATAEPLGERVLITGEVSDAALRNFVAHAAGLVFPSLYEGFGLPPLEAMAAGCPCLVSTAGALPEVCGEAALYCDPRDESDIARGMLRLLQDEPLRERLRVAGRARAMQFRWDRCVAETVDEMEQVLA
jgi:glycosyltransferase involved in cell wall biosynthesis